MVNGHADVALGLTWQDDVALGLTGQETGAWQKKLDGSQIFGRRMAARSTSDEVDSCAVGSCFPRSFQRQRICRDRSSVAREPRVAASSFGEESASWQRRQPDF